MVKPYHFDFSCSVRQRWFGQNIIDIFSREFPARDRAYYLQALTDGRLRVEGCEVTAETPLRDGQRMRHFIHRHEPPVPAGPIQVVGQSADAVAVCKPHGMPVHVAGQYRKNTVHGILTAERPDLGPLHPVHRLDKPVSGLLLFARSPQAASSLCAQIESRGVEKVYVARVLGRFPEAPPGKQFVVADVPLDWDPVANMASAVPEAASSAAGADGVDAPGAAAAAAGSVAAAAGEANRAAEGEAAGAAGSGEQQDGQQTQQAQAQAQAQAQQQGSAAGEGLSREQRKLLKKQQRHQRRAAKAERQEAAAAAAAAAAKRPGRSVPKPALTEFKLLAVAPDGLTSLVECRPRTGRTHQIRVHLQWLGHPIANDAQYGGTYGGPVASRQLALQMGVHWASKGGEGADGGTSSQEAAAATTGTEEPAVEQQAAGAAEQQAALPSAAPAAAGQVADADAYAQNAAFRSEPQYRLPLELCDGLCIHCPFYAPKDYPLDLRPLWLHARSYSCVDGSWSFSTELPQWAPADWAPSPPAH
ncbi:pseudouridine synthase family [Chlorella sorokiniana]|uniref:Pseudouridine synthase family n=1 Tax=Chlorella sorokiniana TaxID=3076 RepID=A0A2P6TYT2_CHLSO|nr:pseudouridine synthase family [Chlorella sorokiniana]|eukprot:PRW59227.1 pseudouridine synthase family [Chlorella sorokiniana]